jgi:WD40 repeat protein
LFFHAAAAAAVRSLTSGERLVEVEGQRAGAAAAAKAAAAAAAKANVYTGAAPSLGDEVGHSGAVLALAVSTDGTLLASAGVDRLVVVWEAGSLACLRKFKGHRNTVTCLSFRRKTHQLFSGSDDRTIKIWNLDAMS